MLFSAERICITQSLDNRWLEACYDHAFLRSKPNTHLGSTDEGVSFYAVTLDRTVEVLEAMSAHQRMELLLRSCAQDNLRKVRHGEGFPEDNPNAE